VKATPLELAGVVLFEPDVHEDPRGSFVELWQAERYTAFGVPREFAQDNVVTSTGGVFRGLHVQYPNPQGKLVTVLEGEIHDAVLDVRRSSPTFGRLIFATLEGTAKRQLWIPPGFAHGYFVASARALVAYKTTTPWSPADETIIDAFDPALEIPWIGASRSPRDAAAPRLAEIPAERLPP
jgi:dTDP-4-dehydrorhamnose 3,5-epimerase